MSHKEYLVIPYQEAVDGTMIYKHARLVFSKAANDRDWICIMSDECLRDLQHYITLPDAVRQRAFQNIPEYKGYYFQDYDEYCKKMWASQINEEKI